MGRMILSLKQYKNVTEGFHQNTKGTRQLLRDACVCSIKGFAWNTGQSLLHTTTMAHDTWYNDYCILLGLSQYCQYNFEHIHRMEIALIIITGHFNKTYLPNFVCNVQFTQRNIGCACEILLYSRYHRKT